MKQHDLKREAFITMRTWVQPSCAHGYPSVCRLLWHLSRDSSRNDMPHPSTSHLNRHMCECEDVRISQDKLERQHASVVEGVFFELFVFCESLAAVRTLGTHTYDCHSTCVATSNGTYDVWQHNLVGALVPEHGVPVVKRLATPLVTTPESTWMSPDRCY